MYLTLSALVVASLAGCLGLVLGACLGADRLDRARRDAFLWKRLALNLLDLEDAADVTIRQPDPAHPSHRASLRVAR